MLNVELTSFLVVYPAVDARPACDVVQNNVVSVLSPVHALEGRRQPLTVVLEGAHIRHVVLGPQGLHQIERGVEAERKKIKSKKTLIIMKNQMKPQS